MASSNTVLPCAALGGKPSDRDSPNSCTETLPNPGGNGAWWALSVSVAGRGRPGHLTEANARLKEHPDSTNPSRLPARLETERSSAGAGSQLPPPLTAPAPQAGRPSLAPRRAPLTASAAKIPLPSPEPARLRAPGGHPAGSPNRGQRA